MAAGQPYFVRFFFFLLPRFRKVLNFVSFQLVPDLPAKYMLGRRLTQTSLVRRFLKESVSRGPKLGVSSQLDLKTWSVEQLFTNKLLRVTHHLSIIQLKSSICWSKIPTNLSKRATWNPSSTKLALAAAIAAMHRLRSLVTLNQPLSCQLMHLSTCHVCL